MDRYEVAQTLDGGIGERSTSLTGKRLNVAVEGPLYQLSRSGSDTIS
jgi:hypothetical protein